MNGYLDEFVPCLHDILRSNAIDRKIKLPTIHALGDLALNQAEQFNKRYLKDTLVILILAAEMSVKSVGDFTHDPESIDFLQDLRDEIYECLNTILVAI